MRLGCLVQRLTVYTVATVNSICLLHWTTNLISLHPNNYCHVYIMTGITEGLHPIILHKHVTQFLPNKRHHAITQQEGGGGGGGHNIHVTQFLPNKRHHAITQQEGGGGGGGGTTLSTLCIYSRFTTNNLKDWRRKEPSPIPNPSHGITSGLLRGAWSY